MTMFDRDVAPRIEILRAQGFELPPLRYYLGWEREDQRRLCRLYGTGRLSDEYDINPVGVPTLLLELRDIRSRRPVQHIVVWQWDVDHESWIADMVPNAAEHVPVEVEHPLLKAAKCLADVAELLLNGKLTCRGN